MRALALVALLAACQIEDRSSRDRLDQLIARADGIDGRLDRLIGGRPAGLKAEPDPRLVYAVPIDGDPIWGTPAAKVTLVEVGEFACPFCYQMRETLVRLKEHYGDDLRIVWKHYVVHKDLATTAALAACAAQKQERFWAFERAIWDKQWKGGQPDDLSEAAMLELARGLGLDAERFRADLGGEACRADLAGDQRLLGQLGVRGTPAYYVNGRYLGGVITFDAFSKLIDEELARARSAIGRGVRADEYYGTVVAAGKKTL